MTNQRRQQRPPTANTGTVAPGMTTQRRRQQRPPTASTGTVAPGMTNQRRQQRPPTASTGRKNMQSKARLQNKFKNPIRQVPRLG